MIENILEGIEIWMARAADQLSDGERRLYDAISGGDLVAARDFYLDCDDNRYKPYFFRRLGELG